MTTPLIIDTDPGVDDAFALALAAASPEVDLVGVTTTFGNVGLERTTRNALGLLALLGRADVPVAAGADRPLVHAQPSLSSAHGSDGLSGFAGTLPPAGAPDPRDAVALLADLLGASDRPVVIAAVGPLTNVALLLAAHPSLKPKIERLVVMGGAIGAGNISPRAEFNAWCDPEAARRVLVVEDVPTTLVPMDLTMRCSVDGPWLDAVGAASEVGRVLVGLTADYREAYRGLLGWDGMALHDAVAVAEAVRPGLLGTRRLPVEVDCGYGPGRGSLLVDERLEARDAGRVDVAVDVDVAGLRGWLSERLSGL
ncbi:nucleoside hydrolase [Actinosynnema pretiosum subsp. pretiosum]|uniref:Inosine/uridine-preferring nucleoside hydrolase n=2 Tax=Actinosynnema TaxID=40566 RepID=C6WGA5_ACTMD|nr:nucleoside hydrolase [Actinosynnema mirum]ACU39869.1 Inosine/uridine-preferring nucleoside hydrolase [Actinosynnema mirum DSM 43827]AXX33385.1 Inosine-uridine preferring nucleoside hydrolase [Actinosynnema pretiosum subsp. pretiosum]QUF02800.1 nucleoside hydrolase [Actinosynnema pretiosum subsp. pretiosum]